MEWYSASDPEAVERILAAWSDAPVENEELLGMLLDVAKVQVLAYAEQESPGEQIVYLLLCLGYTSEQTVGVLELLDIDDAPPTPDRYVLAQLQQVKNLYNAGRVTGNGDVGPDGFMFVPRPLSKDIQRIIRPTSGAPDVL